MQTSNELAIKNASMLDRVLTIKPTPRVERLKSFCLHSKPFLEIDHARIYTRVMKETEGEPMVIRRARAFSAVVREMPINIAPDELFVGYINATWAGQQVPVEKGPDMERALDYLVARKSIISKEEEEELRQEIIPYWKGQKGEWDRLRGPHGSDLVPDDKFLIYGLEPQVPNSHRISHLNINHEKVLKKGFLGVKGDAEERLARLVLTDPDDIKKLPFLQSVIIAMEAATEIGKRFAARARELAEQEENGQRKAELLKIASVCDWVPANPARTFYEAMQSVWFAHILQYWETLATAGMSLARADQYLYPYYERDISEGRITKEEAQELIDCWLIKSNVPDWTENDFEFWFNIGGPSFRVFRGLMGTHISVGGYKPDGSDGTNDLSFMIIEGSMHLALPEPYISIQVQSRTPEDLLLKACQLCALGFGQPQFENADVIVPGIVTRVTGGRPITLEEARGFASVGCQEPFLSGMDGLNTNSLLNAALGLELALNNGISRLSNRKIGLETGDPRQFSSFEEVREAYKKQTDWMLEGLTVGSNMRELNGAVMNPSAFTSALVEDCIEKGLSWEEGGARHNAGPGMYASGLPDVADSFAAIKKVVFEDKRITMTELCDALDHNFEGYEEIRRMLLDAPKYGNDIDYADEQMVWLASNWAAECRKQKNTRGGRGVPGLQTYIWHMVFGKMTGALPSGRLAGEAISDGASPCTSSPKNGPTAILKSLSKVNNYEQNITDVLNMTLDPTVFEHEDGFKRLAAYIRTLVDEKVQEVQFNVISPETLISAQMEPDKYQDLSVRVAGYTARFVALPKGLQDAIIAREHHRL